MGYKFQFVTLSAFHALNHAMFTLAQDYKERGMAAYADLQSREFAVEREGYEAVKHQEFVGVGYFDEITQIVTGGRSSTMALEGSTERAQFAENGHKGVAGSSPVVS
jgi:isocitrate lyase